MTNMVKSQSFITNIYLHETTDDTYSTEAFCNTNWNIHIKMPQKIKQENGNTEDNNACYTHKHKTFQSFSLKMRQNTTFIKRIFSTNEYI